MTRLKFERREILAAGSAVLTIGLAGCLSDDDINPDAPPEEQIDTHLDDASNYDGDIEDLTGEAEVRVENGAEGTSYRFDPAAIRVDVGTTVVWEWVGDAMHTVTGETKILAGEDETSDAEFDSGAISGHGETFEHTFDEAGVFLYVCEPHESFQRGAVWVDE